MIDERLATRAWGPEEVGTEVVIPAEPLGRSYVVGVDGRCYVGPLRWKKFEGGVAWVVQRLPVSGHDREVVASCLTDVAGDAAKRLMLL